MVFIPVRRKPMGEALVDLRRKLAGVRDDDDEPDDEPLQFAWLTPTKLDQHFDNLPIGVVVALQLGDDAGSI